MDTKEGGHTSIRLNGYAPYGEWKKWVDAMNNGKIPEMQEICIAAKAGGFYEPVEVEITFTVSEELKKLWSRPMGSGGPYPVASNPSDSECATDTAQESDT